MNLVTYSLTVSLDGYIKGPDGSFDWGVPGPETFAAATAEVRGLGVHLMGRRLYETMLYWETAAQEQDLDDAEREFARIWNALPKVVFSATLSPDELVGQARLAQGGLRSEVERWRTVLPDGVDLAIGGAQLAHAAMAEGLIDEYRIRVSPLLLGGGTPYFARDDRREDLELIDSRVLDGQCAYLRYRVRQAPVVP
ncbi:MAG: dihydrofolate reductase family protein [Gordonia sp. (in: high G+C Gram-positive bacteria)]|uniref:dihydrofolate reductase family protein n=1 Tax=Gordonia sp. (in: high G+C Gram-positive bacteria) TaxID=84139 RepID=UPI003BB4F173